MTTPQATEQFVAVINEIQAQLARLQRAANNNFDVSPDDCTWADVADMNQYLDALTDLTDRVFGEAE